MSAFTIKSEGDRALVRDAIGKRKLPFTVKIEKGAKRSLEQNKLQRLWVNEASDQLGDESAEDKRAYCKLHFGVPILRNENEEFRRAYDRVIRPLPYELKLEAMKVPLDFPVTRLMTAKQKTAYLDAIYQHFRSQGVVLTEPNREDW